MDILINNAGYGAYGPFEDFSEEQIRSQMEVNFFGPALLIKSLLPFLRNAKGKIINVSSIMGGQSMPLSSLYSASKFSLEGLTEGLFFELKGHEVEIMSIRPGGHRTNFIKSLDWAEEDSVYDGQVKILKSFMNKLKSRKKAPSPKEVSKKITKLCKNNRLPRFLVVGQDARFMTFLKRFLPEGLYYSLFNIFYIKVFKMREGS